MENECPYCRESIEHDGSDRFIQCGNCAEISEYTNKVLKPHDPKF